MKMRFPFFFSILLFISLPLQAASLKLPYSVKPYDLTYSDRQTISRIEGYLSGIETISSEFIQFAPNGDVTNGKFYLKRPGKLRMEYNPPTPVLMVTSGSD